MNEEIANAMFGYLETLYYLNKKIIVLCGTDVFGKYEYNQRTILDIIQDIPRIIPYLKDKKTQKYILTNKDGLLEYSDKIPYLKQDYQNILDENKDFLIKVKEIRNLYEHKMHGITQPSSGSSSFVFFEFTFEYIKDENEKKVTITSNELIKLMKQLNILFSKIVREIEQYAYENGKESYAYYSRITRLDFQEINKIYDSDLLRNIGGIMIGF